MNCGDIAAVEGPDSGRCSALEFENDKAVCRIQKEWGYEEKPDICKRYPFPDIDGGKCHRELAKILLQIPAAKRFVSIEPLLEGIDLTSSPTSVFCEACTGPHDCNWEGDELDLKPLPSSKEDTEYAGLCPKCGSEASFGPSSSKTLLDGVDQVIIGCESGHKRRPCKLEWVRSIVEQCRAAGVPVHVKQLEINGKVTSDISKFPADLQIREKPCAL